MLIIALGLAVIGLAALVFAVITSNELVAWVCIVASVLGVVLLIIDALQERKRRDAGAASAEPAPVEAGSGADDSGSGYAEYPEDTVDESDASPASADHPDSVSDDRNAR
jgi:hypothetical protein